MKETTKDRIERLTARKRELLDKMRGLRDSYGNFNLGVRNVEVKWESLNNEVNRITARVMELRGKGGECG